MNDKSKIESFMELMYERIEKLQRENETIKEALKFYSNPENYYGLSKSNQMIIIDNDLEEYDCICKTSPFAKNCRCLFFAGKRARQALAKINEKQGGSK